MQHIIIETRNYLCTRAQGTFTQANKDITPQAHKPQININT